MISKAKNTEEEASLRHEGESLLSDSLERSDNNDEDDDRNGAEGNNCYGDGNGRGGRNTNTGGGFAEWLGLLIPSALTEAFGAMEKAKASSLTKSGKNQSWEK